MVRFALLLLLPLLAISMTTAFLVPSVERPQSLILPDATIDKSNVRNPAWRIALDFGRDAATPLLDSFGTSGVRFPVVVPCEFTQDGWVLPRSDTISYTALEGAITKPVQGGRWDISNTGDHHKLQFTMHLPQEIQKQDVKIPDQSTLVLEGLVYSQDTLKEYEAAFSKARQAEWKAQESLDDSLKVRDLPKKWNPETQAWETQLLDEPLTSLISKHWIVFTKRQERKRRHAARPKSVDMSAQPGWFPGFSPTSPIYMGVRGIIRNQSQKGMVVGRWSAEPIKDLPASYYGA